MVGRMETFRERWMLFWFEPVEPVNLGLCRMLFFGAFFLFYLPQDFSAWAEVSDAFWMPIWLFNRFHLPMLSGGMLAMLQGLWKATLALSCLGLFTRVSTASSFVLGVYLLGLPHNFAKIEHSDALVVIILGIMALSRCGDGCSVDRLIWRGRQGTVPSAKHAAMSGEYTWPVRTVWLILALIFFGAGVSKIGRSGIEWVISDNLAILLIQSNYHIANVDPLTSWGLNLAQYGWICRLLAAATIAFEVGYPLTLFSRGARWIIVPVVFSIQVGIRVLMGPSFYEFMICNLFWIKWDRFGVLRNLNQAFGYGIAAVPRGGMTEKAAETLPRGTQSEGHFGGHQRAMGIKEILRTYGAHPNQVTQ